MILIKISYYLPQKNDYGKHTIISETFKIKFGGLAL